MDIEQKWLLVGLGSYTIALILPPALLIYLRVRKGVTHDKWLLSALITVLAVWLIRNVYRLGLEAPVSWARAQKHGDMMYDGVGGNVAVLLAGWLEPLVVCILVILCCELANLLVKRFAPGKLKILAKAR